MYGQSGLTRPSGPVQDGGEGVDHEGHGPGQGHTERPETGELGTAEEVAVMHAFKEQLVEAGVLLAGGPHGLG
jgi:hypothetical protein